MYDKGTRIKRRTHSDFAPGGYGAQTLCMSMNVMDGCSAWESPTQIALAPRIAPVGVLNSVKCRLSSDPVRIDSNGMYSPATPTTSTTNARYIFYNIYREPPLSPSDYYSLATHTMAKMFTD